MEHRTPALRLAMHLLGNTISEFKLGSGVQANRGHAPVSESPLAHSNFYGDFRKGDELGSLSKAFRWHPSDALLLPLCE